MGLRYLPDTGSYTAAVALLEKHCEFHQFRCCRVGKDVKKHIFSYYFPKEPKFGPAHAPGRPQSTNGLERTLGHIKEKSTVIFKHLHYPSKLDSLLNYVKDLELRPFSIVPTELKSDWDRIVSGADVDKLSSQYHFGFYFETSTGNSLDLAQVPVTKELTAYFPTPNFLDSAYDSALSYYSTELAINVNSAYMTIERFSTLCDHPGRAMACLLQIIGNKLVGTCASK